MITALSLLEHGLRHLASPMAFVRAGGFFENFLFGLHVAQGGTLPVFYNPANRKVDHGRDQRHRRRSGNAPWWGGRGRGSGSSSSARWSAPMRSLRNWARFFSATSRPMQFRETGWSAAFEQFGIPEGQTAPAEAMYDAVNAGWMDLGIQGHGARGRHDVRSRCLRGGPQGSCHGMNSQHSHRESSRSGMKDISFWVQRAALDG